LTYKEIVGRNKDIEEHSGEAKMEVEKAVSLSRENTRHRERDDGRDTEVKDVSGDISDGNDRGWGETDPCYKAQRTWRICILVLGGKRTLCDELGYFAEEISLQNMEGAACFLLAAYGKI
jgi:hypothetical protein